MEHDPNQGLGYIKAEDTVSLVAGGTPHLDLTPTMNPQSACALLHVLGMVNQTIGSITEKQLNASRIDEAADIAQRIITELLTQLLGRPPVDAEIQAATAI